MKELITVFDSSFRSQIFQRGHPFSTYAKFSRKTSISYVRVRIRGQEMLVFQKILRTY